MLSSFTTMIDDWAARLVHAFSAPAVHTVGKPKIDKLRQFLSPSSPWMAMNDRNLLDVTCVDKTRITMRINLDRTVCAIYVKEGDEPEVIVGNGYETRNTRCRISTTTLTELRNLAAEMVASSLFAELNLGYNF